MTYRWLHSLLFIAAGCISPYDPKIIQDNPKLVVDGFITDQLGPHKVSLSYSAAYNNDESIFGRYIDDATVIIEDEQGTQHILAHTKSGIYESTPDLKGEPGKSYFLTVILNNGSEYKSALELLKPVPEIDTIASEYNEFTEGFLRGEFTLYAETQDEATSEDYYVWDWTHYKLEQYCRLIPDSYTGITYTVDCCESCWSIVRCNGCINIQSDRYVNGRKIRRKITTVPYDSKESYFIVIEQRSLSKSAYLFWKSVSEQITNSGGIFDKPPVTIKGNLYNINDPSEQVLGFFGASAVRTKSLHFMRNNVGKIPFGNPIIYKPLNVACVSCPNSPYRTTKVPEGWQ